MFGIFKKKTPLEQLQKRYEVLMAESHRLSKTDRKAADEKFAEAESVAQEIERLSGS